MPTKTEGRWKTASFGWDTFSRILEVLTEFKKYIVEKTQKSLGYTFERVAVKGFFSRGVTKKEGTESPNRHFFHSQLHVCRL